MANLREIYDIAIEAAEAAGRIHQDRLHFERTIEAKSSPSDAVTEVDRACEELIVSRIVAARPNDSIVGEEGADRVGSSGVKWYIDPLDGTVNYVYRRHDFSVSIGVEVDGVPSVGVVFDSSAGEMFSGIRGAGAWLNGEPIRASDVTELGMALTGSGFGYDPAYRIFQGKVLARVIGRVRDLRRGGSAALELCGVACGRLDAFFEQGINGWDAMAGIVIIREAGGVAEQIDPPEVPTRADGNGHVVVTAGTREVYEDLRALLVQASADAQAER